ncbi:hypothetical protein D9757_004914 [Collybiopsis confluens]|uniref:Patatin-like phospholipase domain-containing protein n=1 Tax=Collybiopsis confluens TaxID=2823264 RepID=A0A8H5HTB6_9AGAR|nr:hypothetical protein D9757_004914 [Collybiopsis confluens]
MLSSRRRLEELLNADYVDESHIQAYSHALNNDDSLVTQEATSPLPPNSPAPSRVRKISALSDFAPINLRVKRRRKKGSSNSTNRKHDWTFLLLRWPLLFFIFLFIAMEFGLYVLIRQVVNTKEWIFSWRGKKGVLRKRLRGARSYQEWRDAAATLDSYLHFDEWKKIDEDAFYDWKLVRKVKKSLLSLREAGDARGLMGILETCIRANFAGVESPRLYSETYFGTKDLIEAYYDEQEKAMEFLRESPNITLEEKKRFFKSANTNFGISALCLSGGASFGYYHFGVVKAFLDAKTLLPRVIAGTSAGGLIAALTCTRTDDELKVLLDPELANRITACEDSFKVWAKRAWKTGARFDSISWARNCTFFTRGSMTFKEAYLRTGRVLNISVIPAERHSPTKLLNYLTAPDTVIWSALLASAAVPGILNPVPLMSKQKDGSIVPWNWGSKWKDGSLRVDIPIQALNLYFNVTYPVVSQVNPHVHLFFFAPRGSAGKPVAHRKGKGWRGNFLLSAAEQALKHELTKNFKVIRDLELLPQLLNQDWSSLFLQRFDGAVTIWPRTRFLDWFHILTDPDPPELKRMMGVGQIVTFPKLHMIENRARIEKQIFLGRQAVRRALQTSGRQATAETSAMPARLSSMSSTAPATGTDRPLSVDTNVENALSNGRTKLFRKQRQSSTGQLTPRVADGSRTQSSRNPSAEFPSPASQSDGRTDPMVNRVVNGDVLPSARMSRLSARPFPNSLQLKEREMDEDGWSSESSFNGDGLMALDEHHRQISHSSLPPIEDGDDLQRDEWSG